MRTIRIVFIILIAVMALMPIDARSGESLRHHIIIAIDKAGCDSWIGDKEVAQNIKKLLQDTIKSTNNSHRHYYESGDYLSIVGFRINTNQNDMSVFALPIKGEKGEIAYQQYSLKQLDNLLSNQWTQIAQQPYNIGLDGFSLVSVAKEYALGALKSNGQQVSRTFLIMVTDRHYNGNNFYDEMKALELKQTERHIKSQLTQQTIFKRCYEVQQYYFCRYISTDNIWADKVYSPIGYVEFYEYVPLQRNFTLSAAINYPTHLKAVKKRNGNYQLEMPLAWDGGNRFVFRHLEAFPNTKGTVSYKTPKMAYELDTLREKTLVFDLPSDKSAKVIQLRAWLLLTDGFYNATLMSPDENSPIELGREGLNALVPIEYEEDATILGIKLSSKLWPPFVNNQQTAVRVWKCFLWLVLIGILLWVGYLLARSETYTPKPEDFIVNYKKQGIDNDSEG